MDIIFDIYGNLYYHVDNKYYMLIIDKNNLPDTELYETLTLKSEKNYHHIQPNMQKNKLSHKAIEEYIEENDDENIDTQFIYRPEDNDYIVDDLNDDDIEIEEMFGDLNLPFNILSKSDINNVYHVEESDICALYDTYIYNDGVLVQSMKSQMNDSLYIVRVEKNMLHLRCIGEQGKLFNVEYKDNNIIFSLL